MKCSKSGIKIHESNNNANVDKNDAQFEFFNKIKEQNKHTGVRIEKGVNEYSIDPFDGANPFANPDGEEPVYVSTNNTGFDELDLKLDLNINNYSQKELYKLFGITTQTLTEDILKICKKTVLKTHPDKSRADPNIFLFFSKAYKRLYQIYEFQNKIANNKNTEYSNSDNANAVILDKLFEQNKSLKKEEGFNKWFNDQFEKHKLNEDGDNGYGDWLKSDEGIANLNNVSKANMSQEIEKHKKHLKDIVKYNGLDTQYASTFGGSALIASNNANFNNGDVFQNAGVGYTDLRQAYVESVIPICEDDYNNIPKFKNVDEYNRYRESVDTKPLEKEVALKHLYAENKQQEEESIALAYYYAKQAEQVKQNNKTFWAGLRQLTG